MRTLPLLLLAALCQPVLAALPANFAKLPLDDKRLVCGWLMTDIATSMLHKAKRGPQPVTADQRSAIVIPTGVALIFFEKADVSNPAGAAAAGAAQQIARKLEAGNEGEYKAVFEACRERFQPRKSAAELQRLTERARELVDEGLSAP